MIPVKSKPTYLPETAMKTDIILHETNICFRELELNWRVFKNYQNLDFGLFYA